MGLTKRVGHDSMTAQMRGQGAIDHGKGHSLFRSVFVDATVFP